MSFWTLQEKDFLHTWKTVKTVAKTDDGFDYIEDLNNKIFQKVKNKGKLGGLLTKKKKNEVLIFLMSTGPTHV